MTGLRGRRRGWVGTEGTGSCFFHARRGPGDAVTVSSSAPLLPCWIPFALYNWQLLPRRYRYLPATFTSLHPLHDFPYFLDPDIDTPTYRFSNHIRTSPPVVLRPLPRNSLHIPGRLASMFLPFCVRLRYPPFYRPALFFLSGIFFACGFCFYTPFFAR